MKINSLYDVLVAPLYTEKSTFLNQSSKYVFKVSAAATKPIVKAAVEKIFNVSVVQINILNTIAKKRVFKGRSGLRSSYKKAYVTLKAGDTINLGLGA